ncbi:hypothetical protein RDWZM_004004 [Blomia tropicalis]|uniref:Uncharacterized protein n=1 Tax=Blomia tropicalis TaxID=40697 RepID=A0A9Q0RT33_BLOTA|nr:hypothetical protein RDWZM_004004 [Blomia tropicalis]
MLCCGCKKPSHLATRTQLLDPSVSNNYLYQQHLHLHQQNQQNALAAAVAAGGGGMVVPQGGTQFLAPATTPGLVSMAGGQQRYVGNINYVMQQQHPSFHQPPPNAMQLAGNVVTGPNVQRNFLTNSSTAIFNKQPSSTLYSSMIFPQDGRQSRIVPDMVALQPESFRRVSGISSEVFRQIEAVEAEFDPSTLASQYAEMERRGEMIIRILNPASILPVWLEETCRRYGDGIRIPSWVQFVEVIKRPGQTLGLYIREGDAMFTNDGVYISRIALESPIYQSGCLRVGDEILAVNMVDVQRMSLDDVVIIMSIPRRLILTIRSRPLNATVEHMLPCGNRIYGSESYYDTVASDIYSRVDELRNKPVVVLKQQLEDEEIAAEAEAAEAEAAAEAVAAALDAATVCAEVGLLDAAEIAAASVDLAQPPLRHRSGSLDIYDLELKNRTARSARSALATNRRKLFANTADNLAELAMADAAYAYAKRRTGGGGAYAGDTSSLERPSSRLSAVTLPSSRNALMQPGKKSTPSAASSLYHGRLASRTRSSTGRLLRTSSDLFLAPDQLMDRALLQATGRRHSLSHGESDNPQLDFFLQRYNNLRQMRRRPQSLDRAYKSAMRNSFSTQTLEGFIPGMGGNDRQRSSRLGSMLNTARHARAGYDVCSDTEAYETPSSLMSRRAMTPSLLHATNYANRSSSLPRSSTGQLMMMMGGSNRTNRTAALNHRLAQLEQFYAATAAVARRHTLSNQIMGPGGIVSRPHSAMAGHYSDRDELGGDVPFDPINNRRDRLTLATKLSRVPSTSAIYETIRKSKLAQDMKQADALRLPEPDQLMAMAGANSKTSSLPRSKGYGQMNEKTKKLNQELNARFQQATKQLNESYGDKLTAKDDYELHRTSTGPITSTTSRPLMIDPSGFQQYGPELRSTAAQHQRSTENQAGYSGLLVIHLLGVRGLQVEPSVSQSPAQATERNLYCVVECDRVYKARTVAVQSQESNTMNFDWDEIFDIDMFDTKEVTFLFYTWNPSSRHKLCSKGTIHLPWISTLRTQHVHAFEMRLYETPGAMLYIKLEFHDLRTTFKRTRKDTKQQRSSSRMGVIQLQNDHPLFGIELEVVLSRENSGFGVPIILKRCTEEIEQRGLHLVGIYRLCGSAIRKKNLREHFERNAWLADVSAESVPDINVITRIHNKMENSHRSNLFQPQTVRQPQSNEDVQCSSRNNVILPPISEHFAVSCEQMKNDNDDFLSRRSEQSKSGDTECGETRSNAAKPQADSNNNIKNNFIYGNRNMINHNQQRQFISPVIKDHQTLHLGSRRRSLPLSVNRNSIYSDVGSSHHISTSSTINGSTNPLNWNHSNRNESNISSTSNGHRQVYQPEFRTIEEQQHTPPSCSSKTKTTDSPILTKGNIEDKTPVMNPNLNPISYSKSAPCNSNLFKTETDNGDSTKNQGKIDKGKYFVLSDIYWDNSTLDQAKSNSNDSTVKNVNKNPNQSLVPLQNCFLNNSVQNLFNDTEVIRREIPSSTVHETELPEFGPFCSDTSFVLAEDSNCSSGSNLSTRNSPESVSSSGSIHLASKNKDLLNHYFNHSDEGNSPPIESVNSASLQEIMNNLISKASISSSSSVSVNNSASTPEKGELSNNKDVNDNYAKEPEHKQQTYTETNAVKDSFAQVPMSMQNGSVPTAPPATTANNSFLPTFQNALVNAAAAAAAMQQSNPHQFGQIFGINYFNSLAAQPAIMNANAHLPGHHTVPHAANPASIPQAFPFQFLASMNQAALAAAAAAVSANTSTTGHTSTNSTINSNNTAQTLAMLAATQGGNVGEFDPRFIMEQIGKDDFEVKAKDHREAASRVNECESIYSITRFDFKPPTDAIYSPKVFLGGVPWDMNNDDMMEVFRPFGAESIQRPGKEVRLSRASQGLDKAGYLYLIFDSDSSVNRLIDSCKLELSENGHKYFYNLTSKRSKKEKRVQVIPWNTADSCCVLNPIAKADQSRTVFLGALHGMMNAQSIAQALSLIFGPVEYVSLDTDKFKYPMGSGQAMFATKDAYLKAVSAGFVRVKSDRFEKTIQIDQFLDDRNCFRCCYEKGPVFCKACSKYYCKNCWNICHFDEVLKKHPILMKTRLNSK